MNPIPSVPTRVLFVAAAAGLLATARGQTAPASSIAKNSSTNDPAVVLSPFEVNSSEDKGYAASSALAGTRTNEKLANLPNSISVFTTDLLSDLALNDFFGAVEFAVGAENIFNDTGTVGAP